MTLIDSEERREEEMKLDIGTPVITSHHYYALPLAIICSETRLKPWVYGEFIQWYTYRDREDERTRVNLYKDKNERYIYEPLHETVATPKQLAGGKDIISAFKSFLDDGQYIYDFVDLYYIRSLRRNDHFMHDILIYGYDDGLQMFHVYAYHGAKLAQWDIPYAEYEAAYDSDYQRAQFHLTVLYRKKDAEFHPDIGRIGNHLLDYLEGINTYNREAPLSVELYKPRFGLDVYDEMKYSLRCMRDWNLLLDIPEMYCIYEHKCFMHERVAYLDGCTDVKCPDSLRDRFAQMKESGRIMAMLALELNQKRLSSEEDYNALMHRFDVMKELEKAVLSEYYEHNRSVFENA